MDPGKRRDDMNRAMRRKLDELGRKGLDKIIGHMDKGSISAQRVDELIDHAAQRKGAGAGAAQTVRDLLAARMKGRGAE